MGGCVGSTRLRCGEVAAALVPWGFLSTYKVRQAPREMSWKVLLVTQARARDSI